MILGVDISRYQDPADWPKAKAAGIEFAIARASIAGQRDATFSGHTTNARRSGLLVGAYHYLYPRSWISPEKQADVFLAQMGGDPDGYITVVDVEYHGSKNGTPTQVDITDVRRFAARFYEVAPNHPLIVYTGAWYWVGHMDNPKGSDIGPLWHSRYVSTRGVSPTTLYGLVPSAWWSQSFGGWSGPTILQFTSGARVPGFAELVDANAFRGTRAQLSAYAYPLPETSTETPKMPSLVNATPVLVDVAAKKQLYKQDGSELVETSIAQVGKYALPVKVGNIDFVAIWPVTTGGVAQVVLVKPADATNERPIAVPAGPDATPFSEADMDAERAKGIAAEKDRMRRLLGL